MNQPIIIVSQKASEVYFKNRQWRASLVLALSDGEEYEAKNIVVSLDNPVPPTLVGFEMVKEDGLFFAKTDDGLKVLGLAPLVCIAAA